MAVGRIFSATQDSTTEFCWGQPSRLWSSGQVQVMLAWLGALLDWPPIEPADIQCPTLWLVGTSNASAMRGVKSYQGNLHDTRARLALVERLTHSEELERVDLTLPELLRFMGGE